MKTFLKWLVEIGGSTDEPELEPTLSRMHRDTAKFGVGAMPIYSNDPKSKPPTPSGGMQMKKKLKKS